jgi:flagellar biosynthesis/type III secretory pathway chaperone
MLKGGITMSVQQLIVAMEKLYKLHTSLHEIAKRKTEIVKKGDIDSLNSIMKEEQAHIAAIRKVEEERENAVNGLLPNIENPTVSDCIEAINSSERDELVELKNMLMDRVNEIKEQNYLNQQLVHNSLQFVNVSLNLLRPQPQNINYGPPAKGTQTTKNSHGLFSSKV